MHVSLHVQVRENGVTLHTTLGYDGYPIKHVLNIYKVQYFWHYHNLFVADIDNGIDARNRTDVIE